MEKPLEETLIEDFLDTVSYDEDRDWRALPEIGTSEDEPDDHVDLRVTFGPDGLLYHLEGRPQVSQDEYRRRALLAWETRRRNADAVREGGRQPRMSAVLDRAASEPVSRPLNVEFDKPTKPLGKTLPSDRIQLDSSFRPEIAARVLGSGIDVKAFAQKLVQDSEFEDWTARIETSPPGSEFVVGDRVKVFLSRPDGTMMSRYFYREGSDLVVKHSLMEVPSALQGKGLAKDVFRGAFASYDELGVRRVMVGAGLSNGGYAWARFGFLPDPESWDRVRTYLRNGQLMERLRSNRDPSMRKVVSYLETILAVGSPTADIWKLADLKIPFDNGGGPTPLGKLFLRGTGWDGTFDMRNQGQRARLAAYVRRKKA